MTDISSEAFQKQFVEDLRCLTDPIRLELNSGAALGLVGTLQLALRHPGFRGPTAQLMGQFVRDLIDRLAATETLRRGLEAGSDPRHDTLTPQMEGQSAPVRPTVVCLCGSTRFGDACRDAMRRETLAGKIVLTVGLVGHAEGIDMDGPVKVMLDELHLRKVDMADEVLILDVNGYIGASTARELAYAQAHGRRVRYWSQEERS